MDQTKFVQQADPIKKNRRGRPLAIGAAKAQNVTVRMQPGLSSSLDEYARDRGMTRSHAARYLIEYALRQITQ